jgi:hypothetical protein
MLRTLLVVMCLVLGSGATNAGWFGPDNIKECEEKYKDDVTNIGAHNGMSWGCKLLFTDGQERYGKCLLKRLKKIRSTDGLLFVSIPCDSLHSRKHRKLSSEEARCLLGLVDKVYDVDNATFLALTKCGVKLVHETRTEGNKSYSNFKIK